MANKSDQERGLLAKIVSLCKRRGIIFPSAEIYGGIGSSYDYGPAGVEIKNNISRLWWREMTLLHENIVGLDSAIILHPQVWVASGHVKEFHDPLVDCRQCKGRFRADEIEGLEQGVAPAEGKGDESVDWSALTCPRCGTRGSLTPPRQFNLMFRINVGPVEDESAISYLRPETAQGIYIDYQQVRETSRLKIPFGIAQIGKAFRNEITTRNFIFRTREFEQMEMQFFIRPGENKKWLEYWRERRWQWLKGLGVREENLRWYQHPPEKLAHYAREAWDIEYNFPFGWAELEGIHDRGDYDLTQHQTHSGKDLTYFDDQTRERFIPHIIETSGGLNRIMLMVLCDAYREDIQAGEQRVYLALHPQIAPVKAAFFPLVNRDGLQEIAHQIYRSLWGVWPVFYDDQGSIGRRYRRQDEIGTPFCFTVDYQTKEDGTLTVRWRDTLEQVRISKERVREYLDDQLKHIVKV